VFLGITKPQVGVAVRRVAFEGRVCTDSLTAGTMKNRQSVKTQLSPIETMIINLDLSRLGCANAGVGVDRLRGRD
jgi:hypothetical protein